MRFGRRVYGISAGTVVAWLAVLVVVATMQLSAPNQAWAKTANAPLTVKQSYTSDSASAQNEFTYVLEAVTDGAPLPNASALPNGKATDKGVTWTMAKDDAVTLEIPYELYSEATYEYRLYQQAVIPAVDGFTYDGTIYKAQLVPLGAYEGTSVVFAYNEDGSAKVSEPSWSISYESPLYFEFSGDTTWEQGSGVNMTFTFKRAYNDSATFGHFTGIRVDGAVVDSSYFTAEEGSAIVTLKAAYLETLQTGSHVLQAVFDDGDPASAPFTVVAKQNDPTGGGGENQGGSSTDNGGTNGSGASANDGGSSGAGQGDNSSNSSSSKTSTSRTGDSLQPAWVLVALAGAGLALAVAAAVRMRSAKGPKK